MKRIIAVALIAVMMFFTFSITAFAEVSPTAQPVTDPPTPGTPTSPQTGDSIAYVGIAALFIAAAATVLAVKKIKQ